MTGNVLISGYGIGEQAYKNINFFNEYDVNTATGDAGLFDLFFHIW